MTFKRGFTLIELSIAMVIIALLVGGVLVGRELIRQSQIRSVISDWKRFETAISAFKLKYSCIPGDCRNAAQFGLGSSGNGNGYVEYPSLTDLEHWTFWTHLAAAQMVPGTYTGLSGPGGAYDAVVGTNVPASRINGVGYDIFHARPANQVWNYHLGQIGPVEAHFFTTGGASAGDTSTDEGFVSVNEAVQIDLKVDDGLADAGKVRAHVAYAVFNTLGCTTLTIPPYFNTVPTSYAYGSPSETSLCNLNYMFIP